MIRTTLRLKGEPWAREALERSQGRGVQKNVIDPWKKWVLQVRIIRMFQNQGQVNLGGVREGRKWARNRPLTKKLKKGKGSPNVSARGYQFGTAARSFVIEKQLASPKAKSFRIAMWNVAAPPGTFDYVSYLDKHKPGFIVPKKKKALRAVGIGGTVFLKKVRKPPNRRMIGFFDLDAKQLGLRMAEYVLEGKTSSHRRTL